MESGVSLNLSHTILHGLHRAGRTIPSHHSLLEVLDFSLGVSKSQMYAKLSMI